MRRAAVSVTSNIAEGYGRFGLNEKIQFYRTAQASILEIQSQLFIARDVGYLTKEQFQELFQESESIAKLLSLFISGFKKKAIKFKNT